MNIKRWVISIALIFVVIASLGFVKFSQIQAAIAFGESFPEPSGSVKSTVVETTQMPNRIEVIGEAKAVKLLPLTTEYAGPITYVGFAPGDTVTAGQVLLRQDIAIEKANLNAAKARLKLAEAQYERQIKLVKQQRTSQNEVDIAQAEMSVAAAEVENLSSVIQKKTLIAPFNGTVGLEDYQTGQMLDANTLVTQIVGTTDEIWIDFALPQTALQPAIGDSIGVTLIGQSAKALTATIIARNPLVESTSRQIRYRASLSNKEGLISPNQMVGVTVDGPNSAHIIVPTNAIYRDHTGDYVYELKRDDQNNWRAHPIKVTLGKREKDNQVIKSGLRGDEFIATEGAFKLSEGLLVYTQSPSVSRENGE
jgi:membrane fusion protein (multidrug efflux system)